MDISEVIETALMDVRWVSYAGMCKIERKKISDLLEKVKIIQETEKIEAQIDVLIDMRTDVEDYYYIDVKIEELQKQLKELKDGND